MNNDEIEQQKDIELYSHQVQAWVNTRMELDKSILTLSAGAIGILTTLISVSDAISEITNYLYIISVILLVVTIVLVLVIFHFNAKYLEDTIKQNGQNENSNSILGFLDIFLKFLFLFSIILSIITLYCNLNTKGYKMAKKNNDKNTTIMHALTNMATLKSSKQTNNKTKGVVDATLTNTNSTKDISDKK